MSLTPLLPTTNTSLRCLIQPHAADAFGSAASPDTGSLGRLLRSDENISRGRSLPSTPREENWEPL
eukprot:9466292-Prorocentrum_lima.AAC.1